jgi:hypothetical protein
MADMNPYVYALGSGVGGSLVFIGKWVVNLISSIIQRSEERGDRLENKLFETQAVIYPALEAANSAIREAIAAKKGD